MNNRLNTEIWFPRAFQLELSDVPPHARAEVRKLIVPALSRMKSAGIAVAAGECFQVAQALTILADSPRCRYVEGAWMRTDDLFTDCDCGDHGPAAHAWNSIDGYRVCLISEFYSWRTYGADCDWLYEPLREFSYGDFKRMVDNHELIADLSHKFVPDDLLPEHLRLGNKPEDADDKHDWLIGRDKIVFKAAFDRLLERKEVALACGVN